jgi:HD-GYP domain-containing protein (c-di-GMP phosphodiesterase class II)
VHRVPTLRGAAAAVRHHHERWDGLGYPDALAGEAIPIEARVVAGADAYSAITSSRIYRIGREREIALAELRRSAGGHLDPAVVEALIGVLERARRPAA